MKQMASTINKEFYFISIFLSSAIVNVLTNLGGLTKIEGELYVSGSSEHISLVNA